MRLDFPFQLCDRILEPISPQRLEDREVALGLQPLDVARRFADLVQQLLGDADELFSSMRGEAGHDSSADRGAGEERDHRFPPRIH
jgi:hypothetical protein